MNADRFKGPFDNICNNDGSAASVRAAASVGVATS